jgi:hypothetical protein
LTQAAWFGTNAPNLAFFTNNGILSVAGEVHLGDDRVSPYNSIVNSGFMSVFSLQAQSAYFENTGTIFTSGGVVELRGGTVNLPGGLIDSFADITIASQNLRMQSQLMVASGAINLQVTNNLTDGGGGFLNQMEAYNGFNLRIKPQTGDMLGTTLVSIAPDVPAAQPFHTWAALDLGPSSAGFSNNAAVGALLLFPDSSIAAIDPVFIFSGTGDRNAMYVELLDLSLLSDYASQLIIEPNLTIYYARAFLGFTPPDIDGVPQTAEEFLDGQFGGRLRWVPGYAGANSSTTVNIDGQDIVVNSALAESWVNRGIDPATALDLGAISIEIFGSGSVSPYFNGQLLVVGQTNTIVAQPGPGAQFLGWSGSIESESPELTFVMEEGLVLVANFTFTPLAASYYGLFYNTNGIQLEEAGSISFTTTRSGRYSGAIQMASGRYPFTGQFDEGGFDARGIPRTSLFMEIKAGPDQIVGIIGDGVWTGTLTADRAMFTSKTNQAPFAGRYTIVFPGSGEVTNEFLPFGDGYGTFTVNSSGKLKLTGTLADGTKISQSTTVGGSGFWPLFVPLYKGGGHLISWQTVQDTGDKDVGGEYNWIKFPSEARYYPDGFNFSTNAFGSRYDSSLTPITGFSDALIHLLGGNLTNSIDRRVLISDQNKITLVGTNKVNLNFNTGAGSFKGSVVNPFTGKPFNFGGVVLQKQGYGSGYFLGTNQSGRVLLQPTP